MTSQLNVDTIVDKAGSGGTNVKVANTSTYVSEGGAVTQNTVQGLDKAWAGFDTSATLSDSFNFSSGDDDGTGNFGVNFTNVMSNSDYSATTNIADFTHNGSGNNLRCCTVGVRNTTSVEIDQGYTNSSAIFIFYDGAEMCVQVNGDLA
jgi:hypothetical protein